MVWKNCILAAVVAVAVVAPTANAAVISPLKVSITVRGDHNCDAFDQFNIPVFASCGGSGANATGAGDLTGFGVAASLAVSGGFGRAQFETSWGEKLTFDIADGTFRLPISVNGSFSTSAVARGQTTIAVLVGSTEVYARVENAGFAPSPSPDRQVGSLGVAAVDIPIVNHEAFVNVHSIGGLLCDGGAVAACDIDLNFLDGVRLLGATVLDDQGTEIANPNIVSGSGFDYLTGMEAHTIPLPGGIVLLGGALISLSLVRRSAKQR